MGVLFRRFTVPPDATGLLFVDQRRVRELAPGVYRRFDPLRRADVVVVSSAPQVFPVHAQEAITQDGIAFRFSYTVRYAVADPERLLTQVDLGQAMKEQRHAWDVASTAMAQAQTLVHAYVQAAVKDRVAALTAEAIVDDRAVVSELRTPALDAQAAALGVRVIEVLLRDVTFPKRAQALFAKRLDARIRAQTDLENARTTVATARALKNASSMLAGDQTVLFLQFLETMTKISESGQHTFHIGRGLPMPGQDDGA